jgi:hypothetical protein
MIRMTPTVVHDRSADGFRQRTYIGQQVFQRHRLKVGVTFERGVQIVDVGLMVLAVVNFHRARVDVWFERIKGIVERGK